MSNDLEDLVSFLNDRRPEIRKMAVDIVSGLTGSPEGIDKLKTVQKPLLMGLLRLVPDTDTAVSKAALTAVVNMSQDAPVSEALLHLNVVGRVMEYIREKSCPHMELLLMVLVNMTVTDQGCEDLLQLGKPGMEGLHMALLLKMFVTSAVTLLPGQSDPYQHIGALLTNTSRLQAGRQVLLQPGRGFLQALAAQLHPGCSVARRRGCSGALRNCCISAEADGTLQELVADEAVLTRLLQSIGGNSSGSGSGSNTSATEDGNSEPPPAAAAAGANGPGSSNSLRDPDETVREAIAEAISALAGTDLGRKALWKIGAPELLRVAYENEQHPCVCQAMEHAARCFMFDCDASQLEVAPEEQQRQRDEQHIQDIEQQAHSGLD